MRSFVLGGRLWRVETVPPSDDVLVDRTGTLTVATTDPTTRTVYVSEELSGDFLVTVMLHEIGHCALVSFGLLDELHSIVEPEHWLEAEEWACNLIADYGARIFHAAYESLGHEAWPCVTYEIEKALA